MVKNPGETPGVGAIRPLNPPVPIVVREDEHHRLETVTLGRNRLRVENTEDQWEIDEEWWRIRPTSRAYYDVLLEDGQTLTIFRDAVSGKWYQQRYE